MTIALGGVLLRNGSGNFANHGENVPRNSHDPIGALEIPAVRHAIP